MKKILFIASMFLSSGILFGQDSLLIDAFENVETYKLVIRTENKVDDHFIALDNLTAKISNDTARVYYMNYGDGLVSSLTIPFSIFDDLKEFEQKVSEYGCNEDPCTHFILFEIDDKTMRYPIDILHSESVSSLMLALEN